MADGPINESFFILDSAIGPLGVRQATIIGFDIDDYVHSITIAQAIQLNLIRSIQNADTGLAQDRPPMNIEGNVVGGY